jgi:RNA polymerase sigma-70 factor (ECF subfamily)
VQDEPPRDLLQRFVHGDRDAFERLYRDFEREVYRWIVRIVRDAAAADDALVEAFWRAHRSRARFDPTRSFGAWMRRIATRAAIDQLKTLRRRDGVTLEQADVALALASDTRREPAVVKDVVARAFRALPPKLQVVATLALIEEQSHAEIADALDVPVGTVKSRLFRATRRLREELVRMGVHT